MKAGVEAHKSCNGIDLLGDWAGGVEDGSKNTIRQGAWSACTGQKLQYKTAIGSGDKIQLWYAMWDMSRRDLSIGKGSVLCYFNNLVNGPHNDNLGEI